MLLSWLLYVMLSINLFRHHLSDFSLSLSLFTSLFSLLIRRFCCYQISISCQQLTNHYLWFVVPIKPSPTMLRLCIDICLQMHKSKRYAKQMVTSNHDVGLLPYSYCKRTNAQMHIHTPGCCSVNIMFILSKCRVIN